MKADELHPGVTLNGWRLRAVWKDRSLSAEFYVGDDQHEPARVVLATWERDGETRRVWYQADEPVQV